jgi:hypothetical protein
LVEIGDEVGCGFEADVEADDAMVVGRAAGNAANVVSDGETGDAGPTVANLKKFEDVDEGVDLLLRWPRLKDQRKHAGRAEEVTLPEFVTRARRQRGMQDSFDFGPRAEPLGDGECGGFDGREADRESLQAAERKAAIVGRNGEAENLLSGAKAFVKGIVAHGDGTKEEVAVSADVLGDGLHGDVDAVGEGVEKHTGGPSVVEDDANITSMGGGDDGGEVLNLHGDGAGTFGPNELGVFLNERTDVRADGGLVKGAGDAEAGEQVRGELAIGEVNTGGDEDVVAGFEQREIDEGDGGLTARGENGVRAPFEFADARGEFECGGSAVKSVGVAHTMLIPGVADSGGGGENGGGTAVDGRGERLVTLGNLGVGMDKLGLPGLGHRSLRVPKMKGEKSENVRTISIAETVKDAVCTVEVALTGRRGGCYK